MNHSDFVTGYNAGRIRASVDRSKAVWVCEKSALLPKRYKAAHRFWAWIAMLLIFGGLVSLFWVPWWAGVGAFVLGFVMTPAVQKSAAGFVLEYALEDEEFYEQMIAAGVLSVRQAQAATAQV